MFLSFSVACVTAKILQPPKVGSPTRASDTGHGIWDAIAGIAASGWLGRSLISQSEQVTISMHVVPPNSFIILHGVHDPVHGDHAVMKADLEFL